MNQLVKAAAVVGFGLFALLSKDREIERKKQLQGLFDRFHDNIKHEEFGEREILREKREALLHELRHMLPKDIKASAFLQGSYALQTGILSSVGDFDIDIGLVLACDKEFFKSPVDAKLLVRDALRSGSRNVSVRRSCVTVQYVMNGVPHHHVDIAVYAADSDGRCYLAKGKEHSGAEHCYWEESDPQELLVLFRGRFSGAALGQFRRCVRYLKLWKQVNFRTKSPPSIALTLAAFLWFKPRLGYLVLDEAPRDAEALKDCKRLAEPTLDGISVDVAVANQHCQAAAVTCRRRHSVKGRNQRARRGFSLTSSV